MKWCSMMPAARVGKTSQVKSRSLYRSFYVSQWALHVHVNNGSVSYNKEERNKTKKQREMEGKTEAGNLIQRSFVVMKTRERQLHINNTNQFYQQFWYNKSSTICLICLESKCMKKFYDILNTLSDVGSDSSVTVPLRAPTMHSTAHSNRSKVTTE